MVGEEEVVDFQVAGDRSAVVEPRGVGEQLEIGIIFPRHATESKQETGETIE